MHFDPPIIKKLEPDRRSRNFDSSIMVFNEIRQYPNVNFFTLSRSKRRSETSLRCDPVPCDYPPNPDPVEAINSCVSCLAYHSIFFGFLFTSPPIGPNTFPVKLPLRAVPFKHVSTVNGLADPGTDIAVDHHSRHCNWWFWGIGIETQQIESWQWEASLFVGVTVIADHTLRETREVGITGVSDDPRRRPTLSTDTVPWKWQPLLIIYY
jgi:hypothetical protein